VSGTAVILDPRYMEHEPGRLHPERPERLLAIQKVLEERPIGQKIIRLEPRLATVEEITLVHDFEYVRKIQDTAGHDSILDPDTRVSPRSWEVACLAVGGMLTAVDWVLQIGSPSSSPPLQGGGGSVEGRNSFAFVRPPGHHAERARAMGFCVFNNVAIAAEYALRKPNIKSVAIIDYDVHHGNGTQWSFYDRREVFYISTHRYPFYPGTGARNEEGIGKGKGFTLNCPFSGGQGNEEYLTALVERLSGVRLLLLVTYRPGYRPPWQTASIVTQLALAPLVSLTIGLR